MIKYILLIVLLATTGTIWYFYLKIRRFARQNFGTDNLSEIIESQEEMMENTPKSVSGMTSLYLPRLQKDFPELNWVEFRSKAEQHLRDHIGSLGYRDMRIHQTELRDYRKREGTCYVIIQSAVQYFKEDKKVQSRYNTTMAYIQDSMKTEHLDAYSSNCPNCGAPITSLGHKRCEYCGSPVTTVNMHVWELNKIEECR